jgi:branched-chain amino acid transport system permease protein
VAGPVISAEPQDLAMPEEPRRPRLIPSFLCHPHLNGLLIVVVIALLLPEVTDRAQIFLWQTFAIQALFALSVNLLIGHSGIATFGQAAFYGLGAYTVAEASSHQIAVPLCLLAGMIVAGAASAVVAGIASRAAGLGVLMLTLAVSQGIFSLLDRSSFMGGDNGLLVTNAHWFSPISNDFFYATVLICTFGGVLMWIVLRSPFGHTMHAIRDDPLRTVHLGVNVRLYRLIMFVIAGAFGGLAGGLFAVTNQAVDPSVFNWTISGNALIMALIGGLYSFWGPILGAGTFVLLNHYLSNAAPTSWTLFLGIAVGVIVVALPRGFVSAPRQIQTLFHYARRRR